jgi:hypothetical protein
MKYLSFFLILLFYTSQSLRAQEFSKEYGKIGQNEVDLTQLTQDNLAEAVVLFDFGKSYFIDLDNGFEVIFERTTRIKILSESGLKWANVEIPIYQEGNIYETVLNIEGITYNAEDGKLNKTVLRPTESFNEKVNENWVVKKFAMPNVKKGSIIEYKYKIKSQYLFNLRDWEFQSKIPTIYSEYEVRMIPFYSYSYIVQGSNKFDSQTTTVDKGLTRQFGPIVYHDNVHKYIMKDIPAFNDEEFISSINDYIMKIDFQLAKIFYPNGTTKDIVTTWPDLIKNLDKNADFGKYIIKSEKISEKILNLAEISNKPPKEKFDFVLNYVKQNFNWNKNYSKYASKSPNDLLKEKFGNSADLNLFTIGLLNAVGIKAFPVLISTRENTKIKSNYPYHHFFNYVIILADVNGNNILSDATEPLLSNERIPLRCINDRGLIIDIEKVSWINTTSLLPSEIKTTITINPNKTNLKSNIEIIATELDAYYYRKTYGDDKDNINNYILKRGYIVNDSIFKIKNLLNKEEPYILEYSFSKQSEIINDKIYISPFLNELIENNPLKQKMRSYPIDMIYPQERTFISNIKIPEGYMVNSLPKNYNINNKLFELNYVVSNDEKNINILFTYFFKNNIYEAKDYPTIKYYFSEIIKIGNEKVVLLKK